MKRTYAGFLLLVGFVSTRLAWGQEGAPTDTGAEVAWDHHAVLVRRSAQEATSLKESMYASRDAYEAAVDHGAAVDDVSVRIAVVAADFSDARRARMERFKTVFRGESPERMALRQAQAAYRDVKRSDVLTDAARSSAALEVAEAKQRHLQYAIEEPGVQELDRIINGLRTELMDLLNERREAIRANRGQVADRKQEVDRADAAYRAFVYAGEESDLSTSATDTGDR